MGVCVTEANRDFSAAAPNAGNTAQGGLQTGSRIAIGVLIRNAESQAPPRPHQLESAFYYDPQVILMHVNRLPRKGRQLHNGKTSVMDIELILCPTTK